MNVDDLLQRLRPVLGRLEEDLLARADDPGVQRALAEEHAREQKARRTADPIEIWTRFRVTQIAAAWVLSLLFVRTLEDRGLVPPRLKEGQDHREQLRGLAPYLNDRDYLLLVFQELTRYAGVRDVFDADHNPVWRLAPSADVAAEVLAFARSGAGLGGLDFSGDTRFLGDVYEQLDEGVRKRYALLQTPDFVEAFILDRTLTPALAERGVDGLTVIDPTCGSGHFLLGAFERLRAAWEAKDPGAGPETWAFTAVHQVYGVDVNPYAAAIARFRLVLAYLDAAAVRSLDEAGDLQLNVAVADSLLPVEGAAQQQFAWGNPFGFAQGPEAQRVLGGRSFDVVVGNPPYITVKDKKLRDYYREFYESAYREYQLVVPFVERFFGLARQDGWVGAIVGNGFMKRLFGQRLIESFLPTKELTQVIDTSGAYIPGHGTPTVILIGRQRRPSSDHVLAVMGKRGEPSTPANPSQGHVWLSIAEHADEVGFENDFVSVDHVERTRLSGHPWSLRGGGATKLQAMLEDAAERTLGEVAETIGFTAITRADDLYFVGRGNAGRLGLSEDEFVPLVEGDRVRDWAIADPNEAVFPFGSDGRPVDIQAHPAMHRFLWPHRTYLWLRREPNGDHRERNVTWWEWSRFHPERLTGDFRIAFAFVATHNHFVLDRGGKVFKQSAPIIKLPPEATEDDHLALLGYLNSSTACFWMKQVFYPKDRALMAVREVGGMVPEKNRYEFAGTGMQSLPIPAGIERLSPLARRLDALAREREAINPFSILKAASGSQTAEIRTTLDSAGRRREAIRLEMVFLQEELDWLVYELFDLASITGSQRSDGVCVEPEQLPHAWSEPSGAEVPLEPELFDLYSRRYQAVLNDRSLALIETRNHKRQWLGVRGVYGHNAKTWSEQCRDACGQWLLQRAEALISETMAMSVRSAVRRLASDSQAVVVAELLAGHGAPDLEALLTQLVERVSVPYLAALRVNDKGMEKVLAWERTWDAQRHEDNGESSEVPTPPKFGSGDYASAVIWSLRGKLDVPKERFISYPGAETEDDPTMVIGWAGWDHAQRMDALAALLEAQPDRDKRIPLLAGMLELLPWVVQWHGDDDRYGTPLGELWTAHIQGELDKLHLTEADLRAWRPPKKTRGRARKPRAATPTVSRDDLLRTYDELLTDDVEGVTRTALSEALGASGTAIAKLAQPLVDDGTWSIVKQRPITYARTGSDPEASPP